MFNFMKKDRGEEKERKKSKEEKKTKEKTSKPAKEKKAKDKSLTTEDLNRLEEVRRSYFVRHKKKPKKEGEGEGGNGTVPDGDDICSTASASPMCSPNESILHPADPGYGSAPPGWPSTAGRRPPVPPKPLKRGILKGSAPAPAAPSGVPDAGQLPDDDDDHSLVQNTIANEVIIYDVPPSSRRLPPTVVQHDPARIMSSSSEYSSAAESPTKSPVVAAPSAAPPGEGVGRHGLRSYGAGDLRLPPLAERRQLKARELTLTRQPAGDFGFCLRRAFAADGVGALLTGVLNGAGAETLFAEPKEFSRHNPTGLLPGDRLLEVNGVQVLSLSREQVTELIRASGDSLQLLVRPVAELAELTVRSTADGGEVELDERHIKSGTLTRSGSKRFKKVAAKSEFQLASEKSWLDTQKVWVVHKAGFTAASLVASDGEPATVNGGATNGHVTVEAMDSGKAMVKLEHNGDVLEVDEDDLEKANPPQFDRVEDLAQLRNLNESSVLHTLRQRYASSLVHTYASSNMIFVNPMQPLSIYSEKVMQMFKGCKRDDMPPHIYAIVQSAYRSMLTSRMDQSVVLLGRSGGGKTANFFHVLNYLCHTAGTVNNILTAKKLWAITSLLECFGQCRTVLNANATRFTMLCSVDFEHSGQIANGSLQAFMLDKDRVVRQPEGETNYKIFYYMLNGMDEKMRKEFQLTNLDEANIFFRIPPQSEEPQRATMAWVKTQSCFDILGVKEEESRAIYAILAAIYHLGMAGVDLSPSGKGQFANPQSAKRASSLLGVSSEELGRFIFQGGGNGMTPPSRTLMRTSPNENGGFRQDRSGDALEALEGMAVGLYCEVFNAVLSVINRSITSTTRTVSSILVLDSPGFQNPASVGSHISATFEDMCHNYVQERLQALFHDHTIVAQQDKYDQERIEYSHGEPLSSNATHVVHLIDKPPQPGLIRSSNLDLRSADQKGLLWLLDEEAIFPGSSDESFLERLFIHNSDHSHKKLLQKSQYPMHFVIQHMQGTNSVLYNAEGWLKSCRENPTIRTAILLLQSSQKENIGKLFISSRGPVSMSVAGSIVGMEGTATLRRASSMRRTFTTGTAGLKRKSVCLQVKYQVDGIVETLRRTGMHFVHCLLPQHNAGLCETRTNVTTPNGSTSDDIFINVPLLRSQIRGTQILDAVRLHKQGFPDHLMYSEFRRRFDLLVPPEDRQASPILDEKKAVEVLVKHLDIDSTQYKVGLSQIFFRTGALLQLEEQRDERLQGSVIRFQASCRGYLARKKLVKLKVQALAIRCVQRNVRKFMAIREWPWWRLLVRVTPLLNVHRAEQELKLKTEELDVLRDKLQKIEKERGELKQTNNRLETQVGELQADLSEEHATSLHASELLEAEMMERMRLEKDLQDNKAEFVELQKMHEKAEMELMEVKMYRAVEMNGDLYSNHDDDYDDNSVYQQRYEKLRRELEIVKRKHATQIDDLLEKHMLEKKLLEKKLSDAKEETLDQKQAFDQSKRKIQRLTQEYNDIRFLVEESAARNAALEKKQRKFDSDLNAAKEEVRQEKLSKEKLQRERDQIAGERYTLDQDLSSMKLELEMKEEKINALTHELDDLTFGNKGDEEIAQLKRGKHELEMKLKDQEDELDDLAGQVQLLEQAKLRLEMNLENTRKENRKELSQKDEEIEETRNNCQKKLKMMENQLETEHDDRASLIREKHELERKLADLQDRPVVNHDADTVHRLKKELKRTKALLKDAQIMLERSKEETPSKSIIRQLRHQLEDAEFAKTAAIKARQGAEMELQEAMMQLDDISKNKAEAEKKLSAISREKHEVQAHLEENEEELAEVMRKYRASVAQLSTNQLQLSELGAQVSELELERNMLREQMSDLSGKLELMEGETHASHEQRRMELKMREAETRLELEATTRGRLETQLNRMREAVERLTEEADALRLKEQREQEAHRRTQRQLRDLKDDVASLNQRETEAAQKKHEMEMTLENAETEIQTVKSDLKLALKRIEDLQAAMEDNADSNSDSGGTDSDSSDDSIDAFLMSRRADPPSLSRGRLASSGSSSIFSGSALGGRVSSIGDLDVLSRSNAEEDNYDDVQSQVNRAAGASGGAGVVVKGDGPDSLDLQGESVI